MSLCIPSCLVCRGEAIMAILLLMAPTRQQALGRCISSLFDLYTQRLHMLVSILYSPAAQAAVCLRLNAMPVFLLQWQCVCWPQKSMPEQLNGCWR